MFSKRQNKLQDRIDSLIGSATRIEGNLNFSGGLRVDGEINGNVTASLDKPSTLVLSEHGRVNGEISVTHLVVNGTVVGAVSAAEYLELQSKAKVVGDVRYKTLEIQLGAIVEGKLLHLEEPENDKVVAFKLSGKE